MSFANLLFLLTGVYIGCIFTLLYFMYFSRDIVGRPILALPNKSDKSKYCKSLLSLIFFPILALIYALFGNHKKPRTRET